MNLIQRNNYMTESQRKSFKMEYIFGLKEMIPEETGSMKNKGSTRAIINIWVNIIDYFAPIKLFRICTLMVVSKNYFSIRAFNRTNI